MCVTKDADIEALKAMLQLAQDGLEEANIIIEGKERDIRAWVTRCTAAERDEEKEAEANDLWPIALEMFAYWRAQTKRRGKFDAKRFKLIRPFLKNESLDVIRLGIDGIAYQPNKKQLDSGNWEVYNTWELLFRDRGTFERYVNRAPADKLKAYAKAAK